MPIRVHSAPPTSHPTCPARPPGPCDNHGPNRSLRSGGIGPLTRAGNLLVLVATLVVCGGNGVPGRKTAVADELADAIQRDDGDSIVDGARQAISQTNPTRSLRDLLRYGRWLQANEHRSLAADCYQAILESESASQLPPEKRRLIRHLAAQIRLDLNQADLADDLLSVSIEQTDAADESLGKMLHHLGSLYLNQHQYARSAAVYAAATEHLPESLRVANQLGLAWASAAGGQDDLGAAALLESFLADHPQHDDCSAATDLARQCYRRSLDAATSVEPGGAAAATLGWIRTGGDPRDTHVILSSLADDKAERWATILMNLPREWAAQDDIALDDPSDQTALAIANHREAAARWAGNQGKWNLIALAAESEILPDGSLGGPSPSAGPSAEEIGKTERRFRTTDLERLFAESWMQMGRVDRALPWWNLLVDDRGADDFATLVRCAEAETSAGSQLDLAEQRIAAARRSAGQNAQHQALAALLEAQWNIRSADFDASRRLLQDVLATEDLDPGLAGRAQWLIGETFFLGRRYQDAIEAYRRVEPLDPSGDYVAAALVQAGKSFEQLGRTRQAAICYGHLLSRFADSPHAEPARKRLARMEPMPGEIPASAAPLVR